jgi:HK97 family phage prohead protease
MNHAVLYRAVRAPEVVGRNLLGIAVQWDVPSLVQDGDGPKYWEAFALGSCDVSLAKHSDPEPVYAYHDHLTGKAPIGTTTFEKASDALIFRARLDNAPKADLTLARIKSGEWRDVSLGFKSVNEVQRQIGGREVTVRTEVALVELSIAPTGMGMHAGARVLATRARRELPPLPGEREQPECAAAGELRALLNEMNDRHNRQWERY